VSSVVLDEGIGDFGSMVIRNAGRSALHIFHQSVQIIARMGDANHSDRGTIPEFGTIKLCDGNVEAGSHAVFQTSDDLAPVFDRLRRLDVKFEREECDGH